MTKNRKKIISKVVAGGMLISNMPIQTFANEIEDVILSTSNDEENINNEEISNSDIGDKTEIVDSNELEDENIISEDNNLSNSQLTEENLKTEDTESLETEDIEQSITTKEVVDNKYIINTVEDLKQLRTEINTNNLDTTGMIIELGADIDFTGETSWESIGTEENTFKGTIDGKNYTIKNLNITGEFKGLFGYADNPTFNNINFDNININSESEINIGIIVSIASNGVNASNISFSNISIIADKASYVGGIAGIIPNSVSRISNISFNGNISSSKASVGSISAMCFGDISDIKVEGNFVGCYYVGGVVGLISGPSGLMSSIENITVNASLESLDTSYGYVGGVVGSAQSSVSINNVYVEGEKISSGSYVGGIIGSMSGSSSNKETFISNTEVKTKKVDGNYVGGIIGYYPTGDLLTIERCKIYSNIESTSRAGGVVGFATREITIKDIAVINEYIKSDDMAGGVLSYSANKATLENNTVESNITAVNKASGIITDSYAYYSNVISNTFKGKIETISANGKASGLCTYWVSSNSNISGNKIEAEIISKGNEVGGLLGRASSDNTIIENNIVKATISGNNMVGGLIGQAPRTGIKINNNDINVVISANDQVGGLSGQLVGPSITNNKIVSTIIANDSVGGIVGSTMNPETLYSKNIVSTNITANSKLGGLMGSGYSVQMNNNFIEGSISGKSQVGGVIGYISGTMNSPMVSSTVIALTIKGETLTNSVVGETTDDIITQNVYYDTNLTELTDIYGLGLTTSQMQGKEAQKNMDLDFENIWNLNKEFYPTFEQLNSAPDIIPNDKVIDSAITINQYDEFNPLDYVIVEDFEGDEVTVSIKNTKEVFDTSKYGVFPITIVATDSKGLSSELTLNLKINPLMIALNNAPVIVAEDITLTVGNEFNPLKMVVAHDKEDGIITNSIKIVENTIDINKPGVYKVTYEVTDKDGAKATKTITVTVKAKEVVSNNNASNNNSTSTDNKTENATAENTTTEKPQTGDAGFISVITALMSIVGLYSINKRKEK